MKLPLLQPHEAKWENLCLIGPSVLTALDLPSQHRYHWSWPNLTVNQAQRCTSWPKHQFSLPLLHLLSSSQAFIVWPHHEERLFPAVANVFYTSPCPHPSVLLFSSALYSTRFSSPLTFPFSPVILFLLYSLCSHLRDMDGHLSLRCLLLSLFSSSSCLSQRRQRKLQLIHLMLHTCLCSPCLP